MPKRIVNVFSQDSFSGGGTFFNDGLYRVEKSRFVKHNYGKEGGAEYTVLMQELQPVDKDGKDSGEAKVQYWSVGDGFEPNDKGKNLEATGDRDTIWNLSDFGVFHTQLGKAGLDMDKFEEDNDISALEGEVMQYGKVPSPRTQTAKADDEDKPSKKNNLPRQIVVVTDAHPLSTKNTGGTKTKAAAASAGSKSTKSDENVETLQSYLTEKVLIAKNEDGIELLQARMGLKKYVGDDQDKVKAVSALMKDEKVLKSILASEGWTLDGDVIKKEE